MLNGWEQTKQLMEPKIKQMAQLNDWTIALDINASVSFKVTFALKTTTVKYFSAIFYISLSATLAAEFIKGIKSGYKARKGKTILTPFSALLAFVINSNNNWNYIMKRNETRTMRSRLYIVR